MAAEIGILMGLMFFTKNVDVSVWVESQERFRSPGSVNALVIYYTTKPLCLNVYGNAVYVKLDN